MSDLRPNVIVAVIDALRPDYVNHSTAPWLTSLASDGVEFTNAFSPINATEPLLASFYTGKYPRTTGVVNHGTNLTRSEISTLENETFLQERFRANGYETIAFDWLGRWHEIGYDHYSGQITQEQIPDGDSDDDTTKTKKNRLRALVEDRLQGTIPSSLYGHFCRLKFRIAPPTVEPAGWLPDSADVVVERAIAEIDSCEAPYYLFLHFWDTHAPYEAPDEYAERYGSIDDPVARYRGAISYVDDQMKKLSTEVEQPERPTVFLVLGDHGESLGEHDIYYDHHGLYDTTIHVPVFLDHPSLESGQRITEFIQHIDLAPTLLDLVLDETPADIDGRSILPVLDGGESTREYVFAEESHTQRKAAIRSSRYKYIESIGESPVCKGCNFVHGGERELYDLHEDPDETRNLVESRPEIARQLAERLSEWRAETSTERRDVRNALLRLLETEEFRAAI